MGVAEDVPEGVGEPVPGSLGKEQRPLVQDVDEPGRIATRAHVARPVRRSSREQHERRAVDEPAREVVQAVGELRLDEVARLSEERAQLGLVADRRDRPLRHVAFTAAISFTIESFALPNSIVVCGSRKSSLSMPANPGAIERFITITLAALSTSRIGMP